MGPTCLIVPDFGKVVHEGLGKVVSDAEEELKNLRYVDADSVYKADFLKATLTAFPAIIRLAKRFSDLALKMAGEETDEKRKKELEVIAETCNRVPEHPARTFREGIQSFFFYWIMTASGTTPGGRFDQYMYPLYKEDIEKGRLNDEEALELFECLRLKIMQLNFVGGGKGQREKWAGMARWHNFIIGGCDKNGRDATNPLSYLLLEAARDCQTPHPTLTVRVSQNTPKEFMLKALEVVKTGIGMPSFISEDSYLKFLVGEGVPIEEAREFAIAGCLDVQLPGKSRNNAFGMFIVPMVLELALNNGMDPKTGELLGVETGNFEDFKTYDEFLDAFKIQLRHIMGEISEEHNILLIAQRDAFPDVVHSALLDNGIKLGKDGLNRQMLFENGSAINMVGMCNTVDSLAAIKKLVFDEKLVAAHELKAALAANWEGYEKIHKLCLESPKFGNNDPYVDMIATDIWDSYSEIARTFTSVFGKPVLPTAISITAHVPGGAITGATPDGRYAGETFADGSISPAQGKDVNGPLAVLQSAMKINQDKFMATLLNMKFHPSALKNESDLEKLGSMIRTYLTNGGKHIQFNIVSRETLIAAKADKQKYRDLIVRVAGYSAYFVSLTPKVQDEIIARSEQRL
jgi:formate C-acetyltransferase